MQLQSYTFVQQRKTVLANWLLPKSLEKLSFVEEWGQKPAKFRREKAGRLASSVTLLTGGWLLDGINREGWVMSALLEQFSNRWTV